MPILNLFKKIDVTFIVGISLLILLSILVLRSIAPSLFPLYYIYLVVAIIAFAIFTQIDFEILMIFKNYFYIASLVFLALPLLIGQVTRGAVRWINLGVTTLQPVEIVRPFLLLFFACYLTEKPITLLRISKALILLAIPTLLILIQPSLGMTILLVIGFVGVVLAVDVKKKYLAIGAGFVIMLIPLVWLLLAPYQKQRINSFLNSSRDPYGAGYNSLQSIISVGSGGLFGRGLGKGIGTQLSYLPEKHTDFIFASIAEELGMFGSLLVLAGTIFIFLKLIAIIDSPVNYTARAYVAGLFLTLFIQTMVHVGMNEGLLPITGVPYPLISAGGSSLLGTVIGLSIAMQAKKR